MDVAIVLWNRARLLQALEDRGKGRIMSGQIITDGSLQGGREWLLTEFRLFGIEVDMLRVTRLALGTISKAHSLVNDPGQVSGMTPVAVAALAENIREAFGEVK